MDSMVELRKVSKRFGAFVAVADVDLQIREGEFITLLGPSGCGKTTLLRMISGFETPSEGQVFLGGEDVTHVPAYRRNVNQVFQSYALFPHMTVKENIGFGLRMQKVAKAEMEERIAGVVSMVSLSGMENRKPNQLSGGQRQRVALARAIVCRPKVLLLDEPLSALDAKLRHAMQVELKRLQQKLGITFIFVTHDQEEALTMSDRIAVINKGRIEQLGDVSDIYHRPKTTFVANFIGQANILEAEFSSREGAHVKVKLAGSSIELAVSSTSVSREITKVLVSIRPEKLHLQKKRPPEEENCFEVEVVEEIFKGATDQLLLRTESGLELLAVVANESSAQELFHKGDKLFCYLHPDDAVVIEE